MITDIEAPGYYDSQNIDALIHDLHRAGLYNLSELIKSQFEAIQNHETELEETSEAASEQGFTCGYDACLDDNCSSEKANMFATWFLREFEPASKKKIKTKEIGNTEFIIMTTYDYDELKRKFHDMCD